MRTIDHFSQLCFDINQVRMMRRSGRKRKAEESLELLRRLSIIQGWTICYETAAYDKKTGRGFVGQASE